MEIKKFLMQIMLMVQVIASDDIAPKPSTKDIHYIKEMSATTLCSKLDFCGGNPVIIKGRTKLITANTCSTLSPFDGKLFSCCKKLSFKSKVDMCHLENCTGYPENLFAEIEGYFSIIRISYVCGTEDEKKKEEDSAEKNDFPIAGYVVIGLVLALVVIVGTAGLVILRCKKHNDNHEGDTRKPATNPVYDSIEDTVDDSDDPNSKFEPENNQNYSEIGPQCYSRGNTFDIGQSTDYNKLSLKFPKVHHSSTNGFGSETTYNGVDATYSHTNEIILAEIDDTYNHLNLSAAQAGVNFDNTYNVMTFPEDRNDQVGVMMDSGEYNHIGAAASSAMEPKNEGSDMEYYAFENQTCEYEDRESSLKKPIYFILEKLP